MNRRLPLAFATLWLGMPLLYALSAGPVMYAKTSGWLGLSEEAFARLYHPLIRAEERIPVFGRAMHWYVSFWQQLDSTAARSGGCVTECRPAPFSRPQSIAGIRNLRGIAGIE